MDRTAVTGLPLRLKTIAAGRDVFREGGHRAEASFVIDGMLCRYKLLSNGRRQIVSFHYPGDSPTFKGCISGRWIIRWRR